MSLLYFTLFTGFLSIREPSSNFRYSALIQRCRTTKIIDLAKTCENGEGVGVGQRQQRTLHVLLFLLLLFLSFLSFIIIIFFFFCHFLVGQMPVCQKSFDAPVSKFFSFVLLGKYRVDCQHSRKRESEKAVDGRLKKNAFLIEQYKTKRTLRGRYLF